MSEQPTNPVYQEILRLEEMLKDAGIAYQIDRVRDGWHIAFPCNGEKRKCSIREFSGTRGCAKDRLEIAGLLNAEERKYDDRVGWLTAENVFDRIKRDWERRRKRVRHQEVELPKESV